MRTRNRNAQDKVDSGNNERKSSVFESVFNASYVPFEELFNETYFGFRTTATSSESKSDEQPGEEK
jgi:hypothetical protein